jgi:aquaporin Z
MRKHLVEFIGTFFIVFTFGAAVIPPGVGLFWPLAVGATVMAMMFAGAHVSGGHFNPAVTFAAWIRGRCPAREAISYWIVQVAAACVAAWLIKFFKVEGSAQELPIGIKAAFVAEFLFTFAVAWVFLNVATAKATAGNSFHGLAVGMAVMVG